MSFRGRDGAYHEDIGAWIEWRFTMLKVRFLNWWWFTVEDGFKRKYFCSRNLHDYSAHHDKMSWKGKDYYDIVYFECRTCKQVAFLRDEDKKAYEKKEKKQSEMIRRMFK